MLEKILLIDGREFPYIIKESIRAKYVRLQIKEKRKLELIIPYHFPINEAEKFLHSKTGWIKKHINPNKRKKYLFLGNEIKIIHNHDLFYKHHHLVFEKSLLTITSPKGSRITTERLFNDWLRQKGKEFLPIRVKELAVKYGFVFNGITIRGQKTRWGSCSRKGNISLNYQLMSYREELIDYVIIHELCHLIEMNHSQRFWKIVEKFIPSYKNLKKELKGNI